jgi:glucose/arabinose dehydrogenase
VCGLLLVLATLGGVNALDQSALPGGAPGPRSEPFQPTGFARVVSGDAFEVTIDGRRVNAGVLGIWAAPFGTPCGDAATRALQGLIGRGMVLQDDPANLMDVRKRRLYVVRTGDGRSVAIELLKAGLAKTTGVGPEAAAMAAAEATARQSGTGCVWGGPVPAAPTRSSGGFGVRAAGTVLDGFVDETMGSGLNFPTGFAILPTGNRVLVLEKEGYVRLIENGALNPTPVLNIKDTVNNYHDRGLLGIVLAPDFASTGHFYLYFTYEHDNTNSTGPKTNRVVRYTLSGNSAGSPQIILGSISGNGCATIPSDCLPADEASHDGGALRFDSNGNLFVSTGDAASFGFVDPLALRAQDLDSYAGKILRVTPSGQGVSGNPWWNGNANHPRSKLWARGFRNPFRIVLKPSTNMPYVGDVGWMEREEITVVPAGSNAGWPCYEGSVQQAGYQSYPVCDALYDDGPSAVRAPLIEWPHNGLQAAALAGAFYTGDVFPPSYHNALFYVDYARGWISSVRINASDRTEGVAGFFAQNLGGPVQVEMAADGSLWYLAIGPGELRRIRYAGSYTPLSCPPGEFRAEYYPNETLSGAPTYQACEATINHNWGGGPPAPGFGDDHFSVRWTGRFTFAGDIYDFSARSDDGARVWVDGQLIIDDWPSGAANTVTGSMLMTAGEHTVVVEYWDDCCAAEIEVNWAPRNANTPPVPTITSPSVGQNFKVGDVIQLQGSATDAEDGTISPATLRWDIILKHCPGFSPPGPGCHDHPFETLTGGTAQFTAPDHGDGSFFEIRLTAADSFSVSTTVARQLDPKTVQVTLTTSPSGATILYDGSSHTAPYSATTVAGSTHTISVTPPTGYQFSTWLHGGAQQQNVTVGEANVTYTASLAPLPPGPTGACTPRPPVTLQTTVLGSGRLQVTVSVANNTGFSGNVLKSIQFQQAQNSVYELPGQTAGAGPFNVTYPNGPSQTAFVVRRTAAGTAQAHFTVTDTCGAWPTFVGAGPSAAW